MSQMAEETECSKLIIFGCGGSLLPLTYFPVAFPFSVQFTLPARSNLVHHMSLLGTPYDQDYGSKSEGIQNNECYG